MYQYTTCSISAYQLMSIGLFLPLGIRNTVIIYFWWELRWIHAFAGNCVLNYLRDCKILFQKLYHFRVSLSMHKVFFYIHTNSFLLTIFNLSCQWVWNVGYGSGLHFLDDWWICSTCVIVGHWNSGIYRHLIYIYITCTYDRRLSRLYEELKKSRQESKNPINGLMTLIGSSQRILQIVKRHKKKCSTSVAIK